jgi:hypothetical protein
VFLMRRAASVIAAAALTALSGVAATFAVAVSPLGEWVREHVFDDEYGFCSPQWVELAQLLPALLALVASGAALYRTARLRVFPGWYLIGALLLLVTWWSVGVLGDCAIGSDD